jgi:FtsP/CotA-like multicopper oxidase with cupredoxin domain
LQERKLLAASEIKEMIRKRSMETVLFLVVTGVAISALPRTPAPLDSNATKNDKPPAKADLLIREFVFPANNDKAVRVHIVNSGGAASALCLLRLTVRKINGVPVGKVVETKLPPLAPGKDTWLVISANNILPNNVTLVSTTFKLNADAASIVTESDEANNEVWHNL